MKPKGAKRNIILISVLGILIGLTVINIMISWNPSHPTQGNLTLADIPVSQRVEGFVIKDAATASSVAEGILRSYEGWKVNLNKPFSVSFDENNRVWIVRGSSSLFSAIFGAWSDPTIIIGENGQIIACCCSAY